MHDKTVSLPAQENETLQDRYDRVALTLENNCAIFGMFSNSEAMRQQNAELQDEMGQIREEAKRRGIVLLSPKRLL